MIGRRIKEEEIRTVKSLSKHFEQIAEVEKTNCAQCNKSSAASIDGNHVKNRKQFFEGQAQTYEKQVINPKPKIGKSKFSSPMKHFDEKYLIVAKNIIHHTCLQKNGKPKDGCTCNVRSKKQLFEEYINGNRNLVRIESNYDQYNYCRK